MSFQTRRWPSTLASGLAALGLLAVTGCSGAHLAPLGPTPPPPRSSQLKSLVLQALGTRPAPPQGACPAGYAALSAPGNARTGLCYRKLGAPVTFAGATYAPVPVASAAQVRGSAPVNGTAPVSSPTAKPPPSAGGSGFLFVVPATDQAALTAVTTRAYDSRGALALSIDGQTWALPRVTRPFTGRRFQIVVNGQNQSLAFLRLLAASG